MRRLLIIALILAATGAQAQAPSGKITVVRPPPPRPALPSRTPMDLPLSPTPLNL
jgi:hypothetical protein